MMSVSLILSLVGVSWRIFRIHLTPQLAATRMFNILRLMADSGPILPVMRRIRHQQSVCL